MGDEPETTQVEEVPSKTPILDKTLNSKCHNNVKAKNKVGRESKRRDSLRKKNKGSRKRKYSSFLDELDSYSEEDSTVDSDIDDGSSSESSKIEMFLDEHTSSRFSTKS